MRKGSKLTVENKAKISKALTGKKHSEETKRKMSQVKMGKKNPMYGVDASGDKNSFYGRKHSDETKRKISDNLIKSKAHAMEKNSNWQGGLSFEKYGLDWTKELKAQIRARDNNICQECNSVEEIRCHDVHHIDYDKKNNNPNNLITLCHKCHMATNSNRGKWQNLLTQKMIEMEK